MSSELSIGWIIALNAASLPAIQLGCAYLFTRLPASLFERPIPPSSPRRKAHGIFLKTWKKYLPDGASWFEGGFHKRSLAATDDAYLRRYITETRRGETCHWVAMILCAIPCLWNPWWARATIACYALLANVPCILLQRVNRARIIRVLARKRH